MKEVIVPKTKGDALVNQLGSLYETLKSLKLGEKVKFNLSGLDWTCPLLVLPLSAYINDTGSSFETSNTRVGSYLSAISFPGGIRTVTSFRRKVQSNKTYVPISVPKRDNNIERERLETLFMQMLNEILKAGKGTASAIYQPVGELVTNIFEHSKRDEGYIFGQFYPKKNYLDICIVDRGRGLSKAYKEEKGLSFSDQRAIAEAMRGNSTKPNKERGYGLRTSKRIVCEAMGGGFILITGTSALVSVGKKEQTVQLPNFYWQGVAIAYRIPRPTGPIDIYPYLE